MLSNPDESPLVQSVKKIAADEGAGVIVISAQIEAEIASLEKDEREVFLEDLGLEQSGLDLVVKAGYDLLGLISFFTVGEDEVKAWTITKGTLAPQAAGKIQRYGTWLYPREVIKSSDSCGKRAAKCREKDSCASKERLRRTRWRRHSLDLMFRR